VETRVARRAPPPVRRFTSEVFAGLARQTRFTDPTLVAQWSNLVGPSIAALCRPGTLSGGRFGRTLELVAPDGAAAARVAFEAEAIRRKVNEVLGPGVVSRIAVRQAGRIEPDARLSSALARFRQSVGRSPGGE
jgi:hypothetical protein